MFSKNEFSIAFRYLKSKKKERSLSIIANFSLIGIMLGVAAIIVVMSVMNGFRDELVKRVLGINGHINFYSYNVRNKEDSFMDYRLMKKEISKYLETNSVKNIVDVYSVQPVVSMQVMISKSGRVSGALLKGVDFNELNKEKLITEKLTGMPLEALTNDEIIIGYSLANKLGVNIGDKINITSPIGRVSAFGTMPSVRSFTVGAIFNVGMSEYDSSLIFMPILTAEKFLGKKEFEADFFELYTNNPEQIELLKTEFISKNSNLRILTWKEMNSSLYGALKVERNVMFLILTLIVLVASFNIVSSLVILVKNKSKDIAILKTLGASKQSIVRIFFIAGASLGFMGTVFGVLLGVVISTNLNKIKLLLDKLTGADLFSQEIYFLSTLPSKIIYTDVIFITCTALIISFVATIFPAKKAGKTDPIEALRYE